MKESPEKGKKSSVRTRQDRILKLIRAKGFKTIDALSREFGVTPQTIRRDINVLSERELVHRYHGGAGTGSSVENMAYNERKVICLREKQRIAALVAASIPDKASVFINIGTTTEEVARALSGHKRLRVITNNLNVAAILSQNERIEIIVTGGLVRQKDQGVVGPITIDHIRQFRVDFGIIGISGIDIDGTLLDFDYREVHATRAIIESSRRTFLVADHTKFGRNAMVRLGGIGEIDALFTDEPPPSSLSEVMANMDVKLHVARGKKKGTERG